MVFGNGGPWSTSTPASVARKNKTSVISGPGTDLAGITKANYVLVKCDVTGSGLTKDHLYIVAADGNSFIDIAGIPVHNHTSITDGGQVVDLFRENPNFCDLRLSRPSDLKRAEWIQTVTGGGTAEDITDGTTGERSVRLRPNLVSGDSSSISYPHSKLDFSKRSVYQTKVRLEQTTALACHNGVNADFVTDVDSNTQKYNAEVCTVTNNNWFLRTASGSNKSTSDTGIAITNNRTAIRIEHLPDLAPAEADIYINTSATLPAVEGTVFQKTSDIPVTGRTADNNLIKHSIKNSAAADKSMHTYANRLAYYISDNWI